MAHKIYLTLIAVITIVFGFKAQAQQGFVQQEIIKVGGITTDVQAAGLPTTQKQSTRSYVDGLGRIIQTIGVQASPLGNDVIQPVVYDNLGRQPVSYLPYAGQSGDVKASYRTNALTAQATFYNQTTQYIIAKDANPYTQSVFENSPLQRVLKSGMVGNGFQPVGGTGTQHYKTVSYRPNISTTDGNILLWNPDGTYTVSSYYADNSLAVTDGIDEDGAETLSFNDLTGRTVLKRQKLSGSNIDTYYIYNRAGMLTYTIPPNATAILSANSYALNTAPLSNMVFKFTYDNKGRVVSKTVPAKGPVYIVYDPLDRPVLMQDANMAATNKWNYIKYDAKGRAVLQGIYVDNTTSPTSHIGPANMQAYVNTLDYSTNWYEKSTNTYTNGSYYTNNIFPTSNITLLSCSYFDSYDLNIDGTEEYGYISQGDFPAGFTEAAATTAKVKGMQTVSVKAVVRNGLATGTWMVKGTMYDKRLNPIQEQSNNLMYYGGPVLFTDTKTTIPDFMGVPLVSKIKKQPTSTTWVSVFTMLSYDHMYRLTGVSQKYSTNSAAGSTMTVAAYNYNELGQIHKKNLGYINSTTWLQNLDMRYNIRGQLITINNSKLASDGGITNSDANDVFGMEMLYDGQDSNLGNTGYFNGKLSAVKWMSLNASGVKSYERSYKYSYDGVNRYTAASYAERTTTGTGAFNNNIGGFNESITYDFGGNITFLTRNSSTQGTNTNVQVDNLTYTQNAANPNRLDKVLDGVGTNYTSIGFKNITGALSTATYTYDANGNLTADPYKGIGLEYNVVNRTDKVTFTSSANRYIDYTYDASGQLIRKRQYENVGGVSTLQATTDYVDGFVFVNSTLSYFPMPEGRVIYSSGAFLQEFVITDQQGNARLSFQNVSGTLQVKQENSYYGYGLVMANSPVSTPSQANKQLYNGGSEWQNDFADLPDYYQTFNRNYDAALGRWVGVDPVAESQANKSPYQYAANNPITYNDPLGDLLPLPGSKNAPIPPAMPNIPTRRGPLNPNWQNEGAFDDDGPFSSDEGRAGDSFWHNEPAQADYSTFWDNAMTYLYDIMDALKDYTDYDVTVSNESLAWGVIHENAFNLGLVNSDGTFTTVQSANPAAFGGFDVGENGSAAHGPNVSASQLNWQSKEWGKMYIITNVGTGASVTAGHAWIRLESKNGTVTTMSLYGNRGTQEFWVNLEANMGYGVSSRSVSITTAQIQLINNFNSVASNVDWSMSYTCAGYSAALWNYVTNEHLSAAESYAGFDTTTPRTLSGSINSANSPPSGKP
ncbi:hypothetical protein IDJ77_08250 [Mucilaginibacter sp. ZT4R22]|uniref:DUF6443 domain-containing protein n=1 Tax=Mucilaginibacter pankratovii TaxID=2772110 RepID=A0ABR7WNB5_9SPHI|nr:DUF6443 domain-containing protein [Mucilaginibacter pankratovii]MBD1363800.1 hypothetical protein [Mucilaginibacter pankratovii]